MKELMKKQNTKIKKERGITLIALVVTIIVLLILAGISIMMLTGQTGILRNAQEASNRTKEAEAKEELDMWLMEWQKNKHIDGDTDLQGFLEEKGVKVTETGDGKLEVESRGYKFIVDPETLETKEKGIPEFTVDVGEVEETEGRKKVTVKVTVTNKDELGSIDGAVLKGEKGDIQGTINEGEITFEVEKNGNYTLELNTTTEGKKKKTTEEVAIEKIPVEVQGYVRYGTIEVVWLKGTSNEIAESPNKPNLYNGKLTPVKWEEDTSGTLQPTTEIQSGESWYDYKAGTGNIENTESHWANAINSEDNSYFVWIPRYAYRITYYADKGVGEPIAYRDGRGLVDPEGNVVTAIKLYSTPYKVNGKLEEGIETIEDKETGKSYIVHPAFMDNRENNYENGGWSKDLEGIWVAKYEMSQEESSDNGVNWEPGAIDGKGYIVNGNVSTTKADIATGKVAGASQIRMVSKPSVSSWDLINIANMYTNSYYYDRNKESHLMKNSEWGAVAYLAHSQYGTNGEEIAKNKSSSKTGIGSDGKSEYNTGVGVKSSTTWNVYGVYDMSGGLYERVAGYNKDYKGTESENYLTGADYLDANGKNFANEAGGKSTPYVTAYSKSYADSDRIISEYYEGKTGDATMEVETGNSHWFGVDHNFYYLYQPFFHRGGYWHGQYHAGLFSADTHNGHSYTDVSFRIVLAQ